MTLAFLALLLSPAAMQKNTAATPSSSFDEVSKRAEKAREQERMEDAVRFYREGVRLRPDWAEGWWYLGTMAYDQDRYEEGRTVLRRFTALDPKTPAGWALLGLCEFETKAYDESLVHLQRAIGLGMDPNNQLDVVTEYHAVLLLTRSGQFEKATEMMMHLAERGADRPEFAEAAGLAGLRKALLPIELPPAEREMVLQVGRALLDTGARKPAAAQREFEDLIAKYPKAPHIHYLFGSFLLLSDPDAGLRELKQELEISPQHVPALLQITFEYLRRGEAESALPYAKSAVQAEPAYFATHNALGRALVESGDLKEGIQELELSRTQAPGSPQTRIALASAYAKAGRNEDAARERAEFLKLKQLSKKPGEQ